MNSNNFSLIVRYCTAVAAAVIVSWSAFSAERKPASGDNVRIISSNSSELILEFIPKVYQESEILVGSKSMERLTASLSGSTSEAGKPDLPEEGFLFAVPAGTQPAVQVIESKFVVEENKEIAPAPTHTFTSEGEAVPSYRLNREFYESHNQFYPSTVVEVSDVTQLRDFRVARVVLHPAQYNPVSKQLKQFVHLKLRVQFKQEAGKIQEMWKPTSEADPFFDPVYKSLVINYDDAQSWRGRAVSPQAADSTANWFQPGRPYYRIPVGVDGVYRLKYDTLLRYGIDLTRLDTSTLALYCQGKSIPLVVQTKDSVTQNWYVEFFAQRRYGTNSYYNQYSDTSMYWLTWNDANPKRFADALNPSSSAIDTTRWYVETSHQEKDLNYFFGVTQDDIENTYDVPGEGWYWQSFVSGQSFTFPFKIDTLQRATGVPAQLKARFYGMTVCQGGSCKPPSRQSATLSINRVVIGRIDWTDNTEAIFTGTFPDSLLRAGLDTLKVSSKSWSSSDSNITQFYLDWFEVNYPRPIKVVSGSVKFTIPVPPALDSVAYVVRGIPRDSASVYDLTCGRRILSLASYGSQALVFSDTASVQKTYYVVKETGKQVPKYLAGKTFGNLRVNTRGADYVVITHSLFRTAAEQLAQHRASANRLRTAVVDVQDIYDEFNFGLLDPVAIRSFLKNAYYSWKRPSPAYVVMFGDASWDFKQLLATSIKVNYVPSFGNPPSDNAFVSFDSVKNFVPYMLVGRIPVENTTGAGSVVSKIINYETVPVGDWNKSYLFITGGNDPNEKATFNYWSNDLINRYVTTYPFGGQVYKVYKSNDAIIDGDQKAYMQGLINNGLVFVNFIGHSGGRIWGVDVGSPYDLQNTNGQLPFVSSVSCNVGAFSTPFANVLAEDFLMADNRGAIATWAAASIGYGSVGRLLVDKFLSAATVNYARNLGLLTTVARIYFWIVNSVTTPLVIQTLHLHPLLGDPYTQFAAPLQPDFDIGSGDVTLRHQPATADSTVTLNVTVRNRGLMAGEPILVSVQDSYVNERGFYKGTSDAVPAFYIPDFVWQDSFTVTIDVKGKPGSHTITIQIDPKDSISELRKDNNVAMKTLYVFRNVISAVKPPAMGVLSGVSPTFVATVPAGSDTTPLSYTFTIDTVSDFSSSAKIVSPVILPGKVAATWQAPSLQSNQTYYWSGQNTGASTQGVPVTSSFYVSSSGPGSDTVIWRQTRLGQFRSNSFSLVSLTDSGMTMLRTDSAKLTARSLGYRADMNHDYYSILRINDVVATGLWWADANSFLVGRYDPTNKSYRLKGYDLVGAGEIDSMTAFLNRTPVGNIVMLSAVQNAKQNVTDSLYKLIQQLGSTSIRSVQPGQSWLLISRKGDGHAIIEDYKPTGIAYDSIVVPNVYSSGGGSMLSQPVGPASKWIGLSWNAVAPNANALAVLKILGLKNYGPPDTLMTVPNSVSQVDLSGISSKTYPRLQLLAGLSNLDGSTTPVIKRWDVTYIPTPELAISAWSFGVTPAKLVPGDLIQLSLDVYNIGYERADSVRVSFYMADDTTQRVDIVIDSIAVGSQRHVQTQMNASGEGYRTVVARVSPKPGTNDFMWENNVANVPIFVSNFEPRTREVRVLLDGVEIRDGDYASPKPRIALAPSSQDSSSKLNVYSLMLFIDKKQVESASAAGQAVNGISRENLREVSVNVPLADGEHTLEVYEPLTNGKSQLVRTVAFRVTALPQLLQVYNYPNPFAHQTAFTFVVTGSQAPQEAHVRVYTVAGRLIRDIRVDPGRLQLGFNSVLWDGRDQDGDEVANGVYLYKVSMKSGDKAADVIERLAKVR